MYLVNFYHLFLFLLAEATLGLAAPPISGCSDTENGAADISKPSEGTSQSEDYHLCPRSDSINKYKWQY
jgi:hypothetical protein